MSYSSSRSRIIKNNNRQLSTDKKLTEDKRVEEIDRTPAENTYFNIRYSYDTKTSAVSTGRWEPTDDRNICPWEGMGNPHQDKNS